MPVEGNEQPFGLLHGGATCALMETIGSWAAMLGAGPDRKAVGIELNASYVKAATSGVVTAVCTPVRRGRTLATFLIEVTDDRGPADRQRPADLHDPAGLTPRRLSSAAEASAASRAGGRATAAGARRGRGTGQAAALPGGQRPGERVDGARCAGWSSGANPMRAKNRCRSASCPPTAATTCAAPVSSRVGGRRREQQRRRHRGAGARGGRRRCRP